MSTPDVSPAPRSRRTLAALLDMAIFTGLGWLVRHRLDLPRRAGLVLAAELISGRVCRNVAPTTEVLARARRPHSP